MIGGYTRGEGRRADSFGSLLLGVFDEGKDELRYVGNVGTGFDDREITKLLNLLRPLATDEPPFDPVPKPPRVRRGDIVWVGPELVAEVEFVEWTHDGRLRAPAYKGLREDKSPREVHEEEPLPTELRKGNRVLKLSNLDKLFFPVERITKGDLLAYYRAVAPVLVPHLKDRPFTMLRFPDGIEGKRFFQKDAPSHMPEWIPRYRALVSTREAPRRKKWVEFPLVNDELALLWMVNMGCIDMNAWYSRVDKPERPDFVLFDLDPSPDVGFRETVQVALLVKSALDALGLVGFPKTSSADGHARARADRAALHVRGHAAVRGDRRRRDRAVEPRPRDDGVDEVEAARRAHRREPERRGKDDRVRLLGPPAARRARSRRRSGGRRSTRTSIRCRSRWTRCAAGSRSTATCSRACSRGSSA